MLHGPKLRYCWCWYGAIVCDERSVACLMEGVVLLPPLEVLLPPLEVLPPPLELLAGCRSPLEVLLGARFGWSVEELVWCQVLACCDCRRLLGGFQQQGVVRCSCQVFYLL